MDVIDKYQAGILLSQRSPSSFYIKNTDDQKRYIVTYALGKLFASMSFRKETVDILTPSNFLKIIGKVNSTFKDPHEQQDAHELINFIINRIAEEGDDEFERRKQLGLNSYGGTWSSKLGNSVAHKTFQGIMTTKLHCIECENSTFHPETFFDISIDIPSNMSKSYTLTELIEKMHEKELLRSQDKLYCEKCMCLQENERSIHYLKLPKTLIIHLKRFKFSEKDGFFVKLQHEIIYPLNLNMSVNSKELGGFPQDKKSYQLHAVIAHLGTTPYGGHYISVVRRFNKWFLYNDDRITLESENVHKKMFGSKGVAGKSSLCAYVLIYSEMPSGQQSDQMSPTDILLS